jgi:restriction system protein
MTLIEAIKKVLSDANKPLHVCDITKEIIAQKLSTLKGKTPEATVAARLYMDIKKQGNKSYFIKVGKSPIFTLNGSKKTGIEIFPEKITKSTAKNIKSFLDAAEIILKKQSNKEPMHYGDITNIALKEGLINTTGKTPDATMNAQLVTDIKRAEAMGMESRFSRTSRGYYALTAWVGKELPKKIALHNEEVRKKLLEKLMALKPIEFEELIKELLPQMGFESVELTPATSDGGIDVRGVFQLSNVLKIKMAVQVKRWKNKVQRPTVQQVRGSLDIHEQGLIITTSNFSTGAIEEAQKIGKTPIGLMNGEQLVGLLMEYNLGVKRTPHDIFELSEF